MTTKYIFDILSTTDKYEYDGTAILILTHVIFLQCRCYGLTFEYSLPNCLLPIVIVICIYATKLQMIKFLRFITTIYRAPVAI